MRYKELTHEIIQKCINELYDNKKKKYVDIIVDMQGHIGLVYQVLDEMCYHGRFCYPLTYKYRRELSRYYLNMIKEETKKWKHKL